MSISTSPAVNLVYGKIVEACKASTNTENEWTKGKKRYRIEPSTRVHEDGAITGALFQIVEGAEPKRVGQFRICKEGVVCLGPKFLKDLGVQPTTVTGPDGLPQDVCKTC